jgi:hypothetical protein
LPKGLNVVNNKGETVNHWKIEDAWKYKYVQNQVGITLGLMKINFPNIFCLSA